MRMKHFLLSAVLFLISNIFPISAYATNVSGSITTNTTWNTAGSPYIVTNGVTVNSGVTLTIDPGVVVKFDSNKYLTVNGRLDAEGTLGSPITFTSNQITPAASDWTQLKFNGGSDDTSIIKHAIVEYSRDGLYVYDAKPTLENITFRNNKDGISLYGVDAPIISNNTFEDNDKGVKLSGGYPSQLKINNNSFTGNNWNVYASSAGHKYLIIDAEYNWWGTTNTATIDSDMYDANNRSGAATVDYIPYLDAAEGDPIGETPAISGHITANTTWDFDIADVPYKIDGDLYIDTGVALTIEDGVIVEFQGDYNFVVNGKVISQGTTGSGETFYVRFTSSEDAPAKGDWKGITLNNSSSEFEYSIIEYANKGISIAYGLNISIADNTIQHNNTGIDIDHGATVELARNNITDNTDGVYVTCPSTDPCDVKLTENTLENNSGYSIETDPDGTDASGITIDATNNWWGTTTTATIESAIYDNDDNANNPVVDYDPYFTSSTGGGSFINSHISSNTTWDVAGSPYVITQDIQVYSGRTLTIDPGVEVRFDEGFHLEVHGVIDAVGTSGNPIKFTSNSSNPAISDWDAIRFSNNTGANKIKYAIIEYALYGVSIHNSTPEIENNTFQHNSTGVFLTGTDNPSSLENNTITNNLMGIYTGTKTSLSFHNNSIYDNITFDFDTGGTNEELLVDATNNWWGTTDPYEILANTEEFEDYTTRATLDFTPFLDGPSGSPIGATYLHGRVSSDLTLTGTSNPYVVIHNIVVADGATLTVEPGAEIQFDGYFKIDVEGTLDVQGTLNNHVTFSATNPVYEGGVWEHISLSDTSTINHAYIKYGDKALYAIGTSPTIQNSTITNNTYGIYTEGSSSPTITDNDIQRNQYGIYVDPTLSTPPDPTISDNLLFNNGLYDFYAKEGSLYLDYSTITITAEDNWWGSSSTTTIEAGIFDNDDATYAPVVDYQPYESDPGYTEVSISSVAADPQFFSVNEGDTTDIEYTLGIAGDVTIKVFDYKTQAQVATVIDAQSRTTGAQSETWDGKDDSNVPLPVGTYLYTIEVAGTNGEIGVYNPSYVPGTVSVTYDALSHSTVDPRKGELLNISYDLNEPSIVNLGIGTTGIGITPERTIVDFLPRDVLDNSDLWDGRGDDNLVLPDDTYTVGMHTKLMPDNSIAITPGAPSVTVSNFGVDPYGFYPVYGEITEINYTLSGTATVTVEIKDADNNLVVTLVDEVSKGAGSHSVEWDGYDSSDELVASAGDYRVVLTIEDASGTTGVSERISAVFGSL